MRLLFAVLLLHVSVQAQTTARQALDDWLAAYSTPDQGKLGAFWHKYNPPRLKGLASESAFQRQTGGFALVRVNKESALEVEALLKERNGDGYGELTLRLQSAAMPYFRYYGYRAVDPPDELQPAAASVEAWIAESAAEAEALAGRDEFAGAVLIARSGNVLLQKAWGSCDRQADVLCTKETRFRLGSLNKMFTAVAVLQLVEEGKLALDGFLGDYWPDYPHAEVARKATIRQLLTHTSGLGDVPGQSFARNRLELKNLRDYVRLYGESVSISNSPSRFSFSNYGYILLGLLVERASGIDYYDYLSDHIFQPLEITGTGFLPESETVVNRAAGYMKIDGNWGSNAGTLPWRGTPSFGGYGTVGDLFRFAEGLRNGKLVPLARLAQATQDQTSGHGYGFGFETGEFYGHSGGAPGTSAQLRVYPDSGVVVAVLANLDPSAASRLTRFIHLHRPRSIRRTAAPPAN